MADLPIPFTAPMVRALLREIEQPGTGKTQTRRILPAGKVYEDIASEAAEDFELRGWHGFRRGEALCAAKTRYAVGDRLWVKETWSARMTHGWTIADARSRMYREEIVYRADGHDSIDGWWPSLFLPREFSRITLTVTEVRVQRLQDLSEADASAEGMIEHPERFFSHHPDPREPSYGSAVTAFGVLWDSLNDKPKRPGCAWHDNPWVAAYTFTPALGNIDQVRP